MKATIELRPTVPSNLTDLRHIPLTDLPNQDAKTLGDALDRILPETPVLSVPVTIFNSAI